MIRFHFSARWLFVPHLFPSIFSGFRNIWGWNQWFQSPAGRHYLANQHIRKDELFRRGKPWTPAHSVCSSCLQTTQETGSVQGSCGVFTLVLVWKKPRSWRGRGKGICRALTRFVFTLCEWNRDKIRCSRTPGLKVRTYFVWLLPWSWIGAFEIVFFVSFSVSRQQASHRVSEESCSNRQSMHGQHHSGAAVCGSTQSLPLLFWTESRHGNIPIKFLAHV